MANWNLPTTTSDYLSFVSEMNNKFVDVATQFGVSAASNVPIGTMRTVRQGAIGIAFDEWDGSVFQPKVISLTSGGTGSNTPAGARTNLGIGSMGTQNSNAVNITGGSITGVAYNANDITSGIVALARGGTGYSNALSTYGTVFICDGTRVILFSGKEIAELNASNLVIGTVPLARLSGVITSVGPNYYSGLNIFRTENQPGAPIQLEANYPGINFYTASAPTGKHYMRIYNYQDSWRLQRLDDNFSVSSDVFVASWDGIVTCYGGGITNLNAYNITDGIVATARMGGGIANSSTFLRGDGIWAVPPTSAPGETIPSGMIGLFATNCPVGWTRVAALDGRFPLGSTGYGGTGGTNQHNHSFGVNTSDSGGHDHSYSGSVSGTTNQSGDSIPAYAVGSGQTPILTFDHRHPFSANFSGRVDSVGNHNHQVNGNTSDTSTYPPYLTVVYCQKN